MEPAIDITTVIDAAKAIPLPTHKWALWAADCAERVLHLYEAKYPDDDRPRRAIEAARSSAYATDAAEAADAAYAAERTWQTVRLIHYIAT